jgi:uncharacterized protein (DUF1330 family)
MAAYVIASIEVTDPATYDEYRKGVAATIAQHGGRFLARGGAVEHLEGSFIPKRVVILEFASMAAAKAWYASPEYARCSRCASRRRRAIFWFPTEGVQVTAPRPRCPRCHRGAGLPGTARRRPRWTRMTSRAAAC